MNTTVRNDSMVNNTRYAYFQRKVDSLTEQIKGIDESLRTLRGHYTGFPNATRLKEDIDKLQAKRRQLDNERHRALFNRGRK
jgi:hypothetical protein